MSEAIKIGLALLSIIMAITICTPSNAETVLVVHPDNAGVSGVDIDAIRKIFLGKSSKLPNGKSVVPVNQKPGSGPRAEFESKVLNKSASQLKAYWAKLVFTGKGKPPKVVDGDAAVMALISTDPAVIAYIDRASVDASVKVVSLP
ncbi:MAG: hypothetical protein KUG75_14085 [Pseudomonadales bacterium]|nr:hypothetical protein [Pseudomonadales bacterium]